MSFPLKASLPALAWVVGSAVAAEPTINVVFPAAGSSVSTDSRTFVIGSIAPPDTPITVNSQTVTPWRTGGFLCMAPVTPGTNTLVFRAGATEYRHTFTVPFPAPAWDGKSLRATAPLHILGVQTGETVRLACLAPTGLTVHAAVGERILTLTPQPDQLTHYAASITFADPAEKVPVIFYADALADAHAATITARAEWPTYAVTGPLFETRARSEPGEGDTVAFLTPGLRVRGAGFIGEHTRFWLAGIQRFTETRHLSPATNDADRPSCDLPLPDIGAGFGPHPPANRTPSDLLIVLDPGHGGSSTGAVGPTGVTEKRITLQQARIVKSVLEQAGFRVRLTRETDIDVGLYERAQLAYAEKAAAFVAIHYNSCVPSSNPNTVRHLATYFWNAIGEQLARAIHPHVAAATAIPDSGVCTASFAVCRNPAVPSILIELDFLSSPEGEEAIQQPEQQRRVADAILTGLRDWLSPPVSSVPVVPLTTQGLTP